MLIGPANTSGMCHVVAIRAMQQAGVMQVSQDQLAGTMADTFAKDSAHRLYQVDAQCITSELCLTITFTSHSLFMDIHSQLGSEASLDSQRDSGSLLMVTPVWVRCCVTMVLPFTHQQLQLLYVHDLHMIQCCCLCLIASHRTIPFLCLFKKLYVILVRVKEQLCSLLITRCS